MELIVLKFGGTSLANIKLMKSAANKVAEYIHNGYKVIVVVSAMAGVTDHLIGLTNEVSSCKTKENIAEYANVVTTGEQVSAGIFTLILQEMGFKARSWLNWQSKILTNDNYADSDILKIGCDDILSELTSKHQVAVVAGFSGLTLDNRTSTLGRGGSDTSAILLAGHFKADRCDIYTDVEGVFTGDPRIVAKAQKIPHINYDAMIAFANAGAKVLQAKSVQWAKNFLVKVQVLSSFTGNHGTIITHLEEAKPVIGVALTNVHNIENKSDINLNIAKVSIIGTNIETNNSLIDHLSQVLKDARISILATSSADMTFSFTINDEHKFECIKLLHWACGLDETLTTS